MLNLSPGNIEIRSLGYEEVAEFWQRHLWPDRPESLRPVSSMRFEGGFDLSIREKQAPVFFGRFVEDRLVGVNSGHFTSGREFRSRGLCVLPEFRGRGHGAALLARLITHARESGASLVWSYPRDSAWPLYERLGFRATKRRLREDDQNRYAYLPL